MNWSFSPDKRGENMEVFDEIKIKEKHKKAIKFLMEKEANARIAHEIATSDLVNRNRELWEGISKFYPETKRGKFYINSEDMVLIKLGEK